MQDLPSLGLGTRRPCTRRERRPSAGPSADFATIDNFSLGPAALLPGKFRPRRFGGSQMSMDTQRDARAAPPGRQRMRPHDTVNDSSPETSMNLMHMGPEFFDPDFKPAWSEYTQLPESDQVEEWLSTPAAAGFRRRFAASRPQNLPGTFGDPKREEWEPPCCPGATIVVAEDLDSGIIRDMKACITINSTAPVFTVPSYDVAL
jgi:hypothetical protein